MSEEAWIWGTLFACFGVWVLLIAFYPIATYILGTLTLLEIGGSAFLFLDFLLSEKRRANEF